VRIRWTETAIAHVRGIYDYLERSAPVYARRMAERLVERPEQLRDFPESGRRVPEYDRADVREVIEGPYRIIYRVEGENVTILAVVHGRHLLPAEGP
jgi:addiction module RelE/StbE family toxin